MSDINKFASPTTLTSSVKHIVSGQIKRFTQSSKKKTFTQAAILKLVILITLINIRLNVNGQDSTRVKVVFQTQVNHPIALYKVVSFGELNAEGCVGDHYSYRYETFTKLDFLCYAPSTHYFEKNGPVSLVITDNSKYKVKFIIDPVFESQKWYLTPPGKNYQNSRLITSLGILGVFASSVIFGVDAITNSLRMNEYNMQSKYYNNANSLMSHSAFPYNSGSAPQKPKTIRYTIPTIVLSCSISSIIIGRILHSKNKPRAERVE